jgi:hypothetical protein
MRPLFLACALTAPSLAAAGPCDAWVKKVDSASGESLLAAYKGLAACDAASAKLAFPQAMLRAKDLETLAPLALAAIGVDAFVPVWEMMEKVPYEHRTALAEQVGAACGAQPKVVAFLQGAYLGLKGTAFTVWGPSFQTCTGEPFQAWMEGAVADPPASVYNERYNALVGAWVGARGVAALPALEKAAVAAGSEGGPFATILDAMNRAIQPKSLRDAASPADRAALEEALVRVAKAVPIEAARAVADRLDSAGAEAAAASLLPALYPAGATPSGEVRWAAAAIEACDGAAVVHTVTWTEAPTRLDLSDAARAAWQGVKPRLACGEAGWAYRVTPTPVSADEASAWFEALVAELEGAGNKVKTKAEAVVVK